MDVSAVFQKIAAVEGVALVDERKFQKSDENDDDESANSPFFSVVAAAAINGIYFQADKVILIPTNDVLNQYATDLR